MMAMAVLANSGRVTIPADLERLAPAGALQQAVGWGLGMRLARRFSGGSAEALKGSRLRVEGDALVLELQQALAALYTDAVAKDLRVLAEALGLRPVFQPG